MTVGALRIGLWSIARWGRQGEVENIMCHCQTSGHKSPFFGDFAADVLIVKNLNSELIFDSACLLFTSY